MILRHDPATGQVRPTETAAPRPVQSAGPDRPRGGKKKWNDGWPTVRAASDAYQPGMKFSHFTMLFLFDGMCRWKTFHFYSNATIARLIGLQTRQVKNILREMEEAGYIWRYPINPEKPSDGRAGIFLRRRLDPDLPVEDHPIPPEAVARLWAARNKEEYTEPEEQDAPTPVKDCPPPVQRIAHPPRAKDCPHNKEESFRNEEEENQEPIASLLQRQRTEPEPRSPLEEESGILLAGGPEPSKQSLLDGLTPGQLEFINRLTAEQRSALESFSASKRAQMLAPHKDGLNPTIADLQARHELKPTRKADPVGPLPEETGELILGLGARGKKAPPDWVSSAAGALATDFGRREDRKLWGQFELIMHGVRIGKIDADLVANAYRQAMKPEIKNRGAKFWAAFKGLTGLDENSLKAFRHAEVS